MRDKGRRLAEKGVKAEGRDGRKIVKRKNRGEEGELMGRECVGGLRSDERGRF